ncbi:MAG: glycosyltransferase family 2 protein [Candidatus Doudnabacteria bacterium]|nr:glycosyltransferase family 2 protein [Candidatus Doudnabacteria bacterium]
MKSGNNPTVSIVVPVYNAARFLDETIASVQAQTLTNWELILVDDYSIDESTKIVKKHANSDDRIRLIQNKQNSGAAISRNAGIDAAEGKYLAFLDADDLWHPEKLEKQVAFMREKDCAFSFTGYEFADTTGKPNGKKVNVPATITYKQALKNTTISTPSVMLDLDKINKMVLYMPNIRRGQDTAAWWKILKVTHFAYGLNEILFYYRRSGNTLSSNKLTAIQRTWNLYRSVERLNAARSIYYFTWYAFNAVRRRGFK